MQLVLAQLGRWQQILIGSCRRRVSAVGRYLPPALEFNGGQRQCYDPRRIDADFLDIYYRALLTEWVLNKAGVKRELLDTVKARKLVYCGHTMR